MSYLEEEEEGGKKKKEIINTSKCSLYQLNFRPGFILALFPLFVSSIYRRFEHLIQWRFQSRFHSKS